MTTLSLLSLLLGGGLLLLSHRMESDARAHDSIIGALSPLSVTRAACACLVAFGGVGIILALAVPEADNLASRLAAAAGLAAAVLVLVLTPRPRLVAPTAVTEEVRVDASEDAEEMVGMTGTFVAPQSARALGRVVIRRGERTVAFAARPVVGVAGSEGWDSVVIVDVYHGTALVAPVEREGPRA
jgi:uncharacterized membrane protein YeiB